MSYSTSGTQSTACATNETFCTPSVTVERIQRLEHAAARRRVALVPTGEVGEACFLVSP